MATLHTVTENTKKILKIGGIIVLSIATIFLLYRGGLFLKEYFYPTPPPPPTATFGKLSRPLFPPSKSKGMTFEIDTVTGQLPQFTNEEGRILDRVNVYKIYNPEFSLLDLQNAKTIVSKIGFFSTEVPLGNNIYQWSTTQAGLQRVIELNIVNKSFSYASPFRQFERILHAERMPDQTASIARSKAFLTSLGLFPSDIDESKTKTELLYINGNELLPAQTLRESQVIRVDFYQTDKDQMPIMYPDPPYSPIHFYIASGERFDPDVVQAKFYHQLITDEVATYPIKPIEQAYEQLQEGKGYIAANYLDAKNMKIKEIFLAYYASSTYQEYLVPIYVFKGIEDEFFAYVLAIPDDWFEEAIQETVVEEEPTRGFFNSSTSQE